MDNVLELRAQLDAGTISAVELAEQSLKRIADTEDQLNSFITEVQKDVVLEKAAHAQKEIDNEHQGPLTGIPFAVKDLFCTHGINTTAGSKILQEYVPPYSSTAVTKCGDAVLMGKTNMDEFALGSSTERSAFGPTHNPFDLERVPGGTSGGSAAAVASGQVAFALGTDTGGSVRQPAAFCGVVGLKPTYGRISRYGVIAAASSLDTVGVLARTVSDSALVLNQLAGMDPLDTTTPDVPVEDYLAGIDQGVKGMRIGIPKEFRVAKGVDPEISKRYEEVMAIVQGLGAEIVDVELPHVEYSLATFYILNPSEVSSNLGRYDGMQYGAPATAETLDQVFMKTRELGFGPEVKRRIMVGAFCLSSGYYDAYYKKAQQVRTLIRQDFDTALQSVDLLLAPTSPFVPFKIGERTDDPLAMYAADIFTVPISLAGLPAISVPTGVVQNLPVGMQLIGPQFGEKAVLQASYALEQQFIGQQATLAV